MAASAWEIASSAAARAGVRVRPLGSLEDADLVLEVMESAWGQRDLLSREVVRALQIGGNEPLGAFDGNRLVGYVLGFVGAGGDGLHVHSHMLAVLPQWRSRGVGFALKLAQRAVALDAGLRTIRWTFDPMQIRNARFNLTRLGVVADRFHRALYGAMTDALNRGDRSDRFEVRWDLARDPGPEPPPADGVLVEVPEDHATVRERDPAAALALRDELADRIEKLVSDGLVAVGFTGRSYVFATER